MSVLSHAQVGAPDKEQLNKQSHQQKAYQKSIVDSVASWKQKLQAVWAWGSRISFACTVGSGIFTETLV